jgi:hypothetical protein
MRSAGDLEAVTKAHIEEVKRLSGPGVHVKGHSQDIIAVATTCTCKGGCQRQSRVHEAHSDVLSAVQARCCKGSSAGLHFGSKWSRGEKAEVKEERGTDCVHGHCRQGDNHSVA